MSSPVAQDSPEKTLAADLRPEERALILEEEAILRTVQGELGIFKARGATPNLAEEILNLRDSLAEARPDEIAQIVTQMDNLTVLSSSLQSQPEERPLNAASPYFGHLRIVQDGRERDVLIGNQTRIFAKGRYPIIDWRNAPISRLYYLYKEGEEYEEELGGRMVEGEVRVHRRLMILQGQLLRVDCEGVSYQYTNLCWSRVLRQDPQLEGGEGSAIRPDTVTTLGIGHAGQNREQRHLPAITSLIDSRQFQLITAEDSGIVVIDGGAGSGKTTIALHRIAYLHHNAPQRFEPQSMVAVVFNKALARYISSLLPALGVEGVRIEVFEDFVSALRRRHFPRLREDYSDATPYTVVRFKQHPACMRYLEEQIAALAVELRRQLAIQLRGTETQEKALAAWDSLADTRLATRLREYAQWVSGGHILPGIGGFSKDWLAASRIRALLRKALPGEGAELVRQLWEEAFLQLPRLEEAMQRLAPGTFSRAQLEEVRNWCAQVYSRREEQRALRAEGAGTEPEADGRMPAVDAALLDREDDTLLLLLYGQMVGRLVNRRKKPLTLAHLTIDEAQDFSPLDVRLLLDLTREPRSVTLAGDTHQRMILHNAFDTWEDVLHHLGLEGTSISPLQVGYRSTAEIMAFAQSVLGPLAQERPWQATRSGAPVQLLQFTDQGQAISVLSEALHDLLRRERDAYVALISRYPAQADLYYQGLRFSDLPRLRRVVDQNFSFQRGVDITDVQQVKGLEYDYVILLDTDRFSYPEDAAARYLLHIGATRAAHQLWLVSCKTPSPLIPEQVARQVF